MNVEEKFPWITRMVSQDPDAVVDIRELRKEAESLIEWCDSMTIKIGPGI